MPTPALKIRTHSLANGRSRSKKLVDASARVLLDPTEHTATHQRTRVVWDKFTSRWLLVRTNMSKTKARPLAVAVAGTCVTPGWALGYSGSQDKKRFYQLHSEGLVSTFFKGSPDFKCEIVLMPKFKWHAGLMNTVRESPSSPGVVPTSIHLWGVGAAPAMAIGQNVLHSHNGEYLTFHLVKEASDHYVAVHLGTLLETLRAAKRTNIRVRSFRIPMGGNTLFLEDDFLASYFGRNKQSYLDPTLAETLGSQSIDFYLTKSGSFSTRRPTIWQKLKRWLRVS